MPKYELTCDYCGSGFEVDREYHEDLPKDCPVCGKKELYQEYYPPHTFVYKSDVDITVGHLAQRNTERFSEDYKTHLVGEKKMQQTRGPEPWYKKEQKVSSRQLQQATPEKQKKYIETGSL